MRHNILSHLHRVMDARSVLLRYLTTRQRSELFVVSLWACAVSALDTVVAGAVIPYVGCLSDRCPTQLTSFIEQRGWQLVPMLSVGLLALITAKLLVQGGFAWYSVKFTQSVQRDTIMRLLQGYLHMDYRTFRRSPASYYFQRCAITAIDAASVTTHYITLISSTLTLVLLGGLVVWQYPRMSLPLAAGFAVLAIVSQRLIARAQRRAAMEREVALQRLNNGMAESFASFREIRVYGLEQFFLNMFQRSTKAISRATVRLNFYPSLPRLILDFAILATLLLTVSTWIFLGHPVGELLPQLIFYGIAARSLLPAMMVLLSARAALVAGQFNIALVFKELEQSNAVHIPTTAIEPVRTQSQAFVLDKVTFGYDDGEPVIKAASLRIDHPSWVAIVGQSGAGKSTLIELICGIVRPQAGNVVHQWPSERARPRIAYIPQQVALLDDTVMQNVVFGADDGEPERVNEALRLACLDDVVEGLPEGIDERIEANGSRLSGGQRQRLAIARALYRRPDLLLLDEATSGLDEATEAQLLENLRRERPQVSVVYTTHRTSNLRFADRVVLVEAGRLQAMSASSDPS